MGGEGEAPPAGMVSLRREGREVAVGELAEPLLDIGEENL